MKWQLFLWFLPLLPSSSLNLTGTEIETELDSEGAEIETEFDSESSEDAPSASDYFYLNDPKAIDITELEAPPKGEEDRPDFLYSTNQGVRLVEFYAHWCPHCQHFRKHYIDFASQLKNITAKYHVSVETFAVSCVPHKHLCKDQNITGYPKVKLFLTGSTDGTLVSYYEIHPFDIMRMIGVQTTALDEELMKTTTKDTTAQIRSGRQEESIQEEQFFIQRTKKDIYNDAYLSFDFSMRNGIFTSEGPLTNSSKQVFSEWAHLLQSFLPPMWSLQTMIGDIIDNMDHVVQSEANLLEIVDKYPPKKKSWSHSCSRGDSFSGYTCGLWELFHIVSIGLVEYNHLILGDDDWTTSRTQDAAETLRDFILHFFGCEVCRLNFLLAFDACANDRCNRLSTDAGEYEDWKEFPMWLYETHNNVNARLLRERAEEEGKPVPTKDDLLDVQWPSRRDCPQCWHGDGRWDPDKVFIYLRLVYWPEDETSTELRRQLLQQRSYDDDDEGENLPWFFKFVPFVALTLVITTWYRARRQLIRTGRHKKTDER